MSSEALGRDLGAISATISAQYLGDISRIGVPSARARGHHMAGAREADDVHPPSVRRRVRDRAHPGMLGCDAVLHSSVGEPLHK